MQWCLSYLEYTLFLWRTWDWILELMLGGPQSPVTPVSGNSIPSSELCEYLQQHVYTHNLKLMLLRFKGTQWHHQNHLTKKPKYIYYIYKHYSCNYNERFFKFLSAIIRKKANWQQKYKIQQSYKYFNIIIINDTCIHINMQR